MRQFSNTPEGRQEFFMRFLARRAEKVPIEWRVTPQTRDRFFDLMKRLKSATDRRDENEARYVVEEVRTLPGFPNDEVDRLGTDGCVHPVLKSTIRSIPKPLRKEPAR